MEINTKRIQITTVGSDGAATGSGRIPAMMGFLLDIKLDYDETAPVTTNVAITDQYGNEVLTVANSATDVLVAPRQPVVNKSNVGITNAADRIPVNGNLNVAVAGCNALDAALIVTVRYLRL